MPFEKRKVKCRDLFGERSCGVRDCQLEVFSIEDDEIITGGFCPLGNSEAVKKPKRNYIDVYHRLYDKHFKKQGCLQSRTRCKVTAEGADGRCQAEYGDRSARRASGVRVLAAQARFLPGRLAAQQ